MHQMTGVAALRLLEALKTAVDSAGQGEMRGVRMLARLHELGLDVCAVEMPPERIVLRPAANGAAAEADGAGEGTPSMQDKLQQMANRPVQ